MNRNGKKKEEKRNPLADRKQALRTLSTAAPLEDHAKAAAQLAGIWGCFMTVLELGRDGRLLVAGRTLAEWEKRFALAEAPKGKTKRKRSLVPAGVS